jgi:hypothetical protein
MKYLQKFFEWLTNNIQANKALGRYTLVGTFIISITIILPRNQITEYYYEVGMPWQAPNLYAPFDFSIIKSDKDLEIEKDTALQNVYEIFLENPAIIQEQQFKMEQDFLVIKKILKENSKISNESQWANLVNENKLPSEWLELSKILVNNPKIQPIQDVFWEGVKLIFNEVYKIPFIDKPISEIKTHLISIRTNVSHEVLVEKEEVRDKSKILNFLEQKIKKFYNPLEKQIAYILLFKYCVPNFYFNLSLYEKEKKLVLSSISKYYSRIHKGQLIVQKGQEVTQEIKNIIDTLVAEKKQNYGFFHDILIFLGQLGIVSLLTIILLYYLRNNHKIIFYRNQQLVFLLMVYFIMISLLVLILNLAQQLLISYPVNYYHLAPMCMAAIIITVFFDDKIGYITNSILAILGATIVPNSFEFFFIQFTAGSLAIYSLSFMRSRSQFFITNVILFISYCLAYFSYNFYVLGDISQINFNNLILFAINIAFSLITYPLIYLFERIFGLSSDLTYVELLDMKHPLLVELSMHAPGTYQHSLQVANLAESAANKIGANGLQCRVGALFHDIGKTVHPEYFIENQKSRDSHQQLTPQQSADVIIAHVALGVEIAQQYNLPNEIIDFIKTHHGTSRVEYFYRKHIDNPANSKIDDTFRYPGPTPITKEQAVVMIADSCEAATRSLDNPTEETITQLVEKIIETKIHDGQFNHSHITFRDINKIKTDIQKNLISIYHKRIKYPD